jgi:hypothetical protein
MTNLVFEDSMGKNNPENIASRGKAEREHFRAESRFFSGSGPRSVEAFTANLNGRRGEKRERPLDAGNGALRLNGAPRRGIDFGDAIGKELQSLYDDVVAQPVPDRFVNLLNMLEKNMLPSEGKK